MNGLLNADPKISTKQALALVLRADEDAVLAREFGLLLALPNQVCAEIEAVADLDHEDPQWLLQWQAPVRKALGQCWAFTTAVQNVQNQFTRADIVVLEACAPILSRARIEPRIDQATIDTLYESVDQLHRDLIAADPLPPDLRSFLLDQVDRIRRSLREYEIRGAEALTEALDQTVGAVVRRRDLDAQTPEAQSFVDRFKKVVSALILATGLTSSVLMLPGQAQEALGVLQDWKGATAESPAAEEPPSSETASN